MKRIAFILLLLPFQLFAQSDWMAQFTSNNQLLIENSIKKCLFIAKQSFQVQNNKSQEVFGLGGKNVFGTSYSLGIKLIDGCILVDEAAHPWKYNSKFDKYKYDYTPIMYKSEFSDLSSDPKYTTMTLDDNDPLVFGDSLFYYYNTLSFNSNGFEIDNTSGKKTGWLVWVSSKTNADFEQSADLEFYIAKYTAQIDRDNQLSADSVTAPALKGDALGGFFIVPSYGYGCVSFQLCGLLFQKGKAWKLLSPFVGFQKQCLDNEGNDKPRRRVTKGDDNDELTPIASPKKNNKKRKK